MMKPAVPVDELLRLETLRSLKLLDTDPDERFDRITRLARKLFGTSIVLVSLVDRNRQWFKSRQGLDATETPREISFCGHAILNEEILVIADAREDKRFADNPLVTGEPNIRFYAGCPLSAPDGRRVGTLCLIDSEPRGMTADELDILRELGAMVESELVIASFLNLDPTTGLSTRLGFTTIGDHMLAMCRRNEVPAALLLLRHIRSDVTEAMSCGTEADRSAIEVTQLLRATFRDSDIIARLSADTFAVLLSGAQVTDLTEVRQSLMGQVDRWNDMMTNGNEIQLTSWSVQYEAEDHPDSEALIRAAEALFAGSSDKPCEKALKAT